MGDRAKILLWGLLVVGLGGAAAYGIKAWLLDRSSTPPAEPVVESFPLTPFSESRYLNTSSDASYVGSSACAPCHRGNHASYLLTEHSRALSDLDPQAEPPDGAFNHEPSGRSYRVYRAGGQLHHEEVLKTAEGKEIARIDLPMRYLIGSGHFCRSYLYDVDGFVHESPITWYASKQKWQMSPGYDFPGHWSFSRPANLVCLSCHAGRVEQAKDSMRMTIHEKAIGCESCHGPGSKHVARYQAEHKPAPDEEDWTIVNPGKLSRERLEDVCSACHLNGPATVYLRGRKPNDFRPGMPLTDYRVDLRFSSGNDQMTVVGHVEQLRQSACYKKSDMTCLNCHDPHAKEKPKDLTAFYKQKCLTCHETKGCRLPVAERLKKEPADDCVTCHMPRGDTDIPHVAFTHHRIGIHKGPSFNFERTPELVPSNDVARLPEAERQRALGIGYVASLHDAQYAKYANVFREKGRKLLEGLHSRGMRDGMMASALAEALWQSDAAKAGAYAQEAMDDPTLSVPYRATALVIRADTLLRASNKEGAIPVLEQLVQMRRQVEDWRLLGLLYLEQGQPEKALKTLQQALAIRPYRYDVHGALAEAYRQTGNVILAAEHREKAQWLLDHRQE